MRPHLLGTRPVPLAAWVLLGALLIPFTPAGAQPEPEEWAPLDPPSARAGHSAVWDPGQAQLLVFGGEGGGALADLWAYRPAAGSWAAVKPRTQGPRPLSGQAAVWDPVGGSLLVYGGYGPGQSARLWAFQPSQIRWQPLESAGPAPTAQGFHSAVWDPVDQQMLVFGGIGPSFGFINDVWAYRPREGAWERLDRPQADYPPPLLLHRAVWDPDHGQMLVFGGTDPSLGRPTDELWSFRPREGAWRRLLPEGPVPQPRLSFGLVWDPIGHRMLLFGGSCGPGCYLQDVWAYRPADNAWAELPSVGAAPSGRAGHSATWDPVGRRVLLFGGITEHGPVKELWAYHPATYRWADLSPAAGPSGPSEVRAAWDEPRHRLIVVDPAGARTFLYQPQTGELTEAAVGETPWGSRAAPSLTWSPQLQRAFLFGGLTDQGYSDHLFVFDPLARRWDLVRADGRAPPARFRHAAVWDPDEQQLLVFGGQGAQGLLADVWSYRPAANRWEELAPGSSPSPDGASQAGQGPTPRTDPAAVWDDRSRRLLVYGGRRGDLLTDLWAFAPSRRAWEPVRLERPAGQGPHAARAALWDSTAAQLVILSGGGGGRLEPWAYSLGAAAWQRLGDPLAHPADRPGSGLLAAAWTPDERRALLVGRDPLGRLGVWSYRPASRAWRSLPLRAAQPQPRVGASLVVDPARGWLVLFGGRRGSSERLRDLWVWQGRGRGWAELAAAGEPPPPLSHHAADWDPASGRLYVFGGFGPAGWNTEVWVYDSRLGPQGAWTRIDAAGPRPLGREEHTAVWDPDRGRLLVFGGVRDGRPLGDLWAFDPAAGAWTELEAAGPAPPARFRHTAIWDSQGGRMVVFGGYGGQPPGGYLADLWAYEPAAQSWRPLPTSGDQPPARARHAAVLDPDRWRLLVVGGFAGGVDYLADAWSLDLRTLTWSSLPSAGPGPRAGHLAAWAPREGAMLILWGEASGVRAEAWRYGPARADRPEEGWLY